MRSPVPRVVGGADPEQTRERERERAAATCADTPWLSSTSASPAGIDTTNAPRWMRPRQRGFSTTVAIGQGMRRGSPSPRSWSSARVPGVRSRADRAGPRRRGRWQDDRRRRRARRPPGDKVGLVGRNGAGKTTLLRVLGGADPPAASGSAGGPGPPATSRRTLAPTRCPTTPTASPTCSRAAASTTLADRLEKARIAMEEDASQANMNSSSPRRRSSSRKVGYAAESEVRKLADGRRPRRRPPRPHARRALGW